MDNDASFNWDEYANKQVDLANQAIKDHDSMVESTVDRQIFAEMKMKQPSVTDFTEIVASVSQDGEYAVRVLLNSGGCIVVTPWVSREEAERLELAINQAMIEYRTKRNAWEASCEDSPDHRHEATCEHCGAGCDYHSTLCLCENCQIEAAS